MKQYFFCALLTMASAVVADEMNGERLFALMNRIHESVLLCKVEIDKIESKKGEACNSVRKQEAEFDSGINWLRSISKEQAKKEFEGYSQEEQEDLARKAGHIMIFNLGLNFESMLKDSMSEAFEEMKKRRADSTGSE